ncbi:serine-rich adhesin for platelets-like [Sitodiplosis mosellana]|uniref:serine-rich adhesin for platelets-like n=1 Tax=Sitodiplosis mosellana TaxID=263140 RepID=UPI0024448F58|nr:serine-rich adhesin for platelets-like [Sitodiplosis mosellana]XP_055310010.1 serine-rich adhesin for platelets-like [Sitodiplosis mosellana]XP_055310011.1 serine-rich adhesin for platelets-like [Sitodiplosis mosellana]XP_055310012.1 serine-rich adhesin for platelets-like [Sitodiplosis mosellana]XP_055310013.1 serine-rich adhesin for platelets-like [Sitodiplosis mosellana]XP_055310014.1 serine-rich adhesin for platelets-like [Sitodiplosis mosellana]XP_055310015.1 serine-rich adhesin for pl
MARRKGASKSNDSDQGWRGRQKQNETHNRKILASDMSDASRSSTAVSTNDSHTNVECQKATTHKESSPPDIFNNSNSLKYLHKKFKRVASAIIEEHCDKIKANAANANLLSTEGSSLKYDATLALPHNLNGETTIATKTVNEALGSASATVVRSSHINECETNSQDDVATAAAAAATVSTKISRQLLHGRNHRIGNESNPEMQLINASAKFGNNVLRNELSNKIYAPHKQYETDLINNLSKCKNDISTRLLTVSQLQQQKTNKHYGFDLLLDDIGSKVNLVSAGDVPQNSKENLIKSRQFVTHELTERIPNASCESSSANTANKSSVRRRNNDKSYRRSQYHKYGRSTGHGDKSANNNAQLPNEDVDLDISQSTSSDLELSSSSTTASSDVISRSTTPLEETQSSSSVPHSALNYSSSGQGQSTAHSIASLSAPDRPYKPKFHKAVYYQNNNNNINTNSISQSNDLNAKTVGKTKHGEAINENSISHLSTQSVEYLKEHISKIISQNEAIMEGVEPALQKKYHKITGIPRGGNPSGNSMADMQLLQTSALSSIKQNPDELLIKVGPHETTSMEVQLKQKPFPTLQQQALSSLLKKSHPSSTATKTYTALNLSSDAQPLNLTNSARESQRKKSTGNESMHSGSPVPSTSNLSESNAAAQCGGPFFENHHPQNPERSIIKSLLLNSRGLAVPTAGEYICPLCNISFRSADDLQNHTKCYCQGTPQVPTQANGSPQSAPISPVGSPSHKYFRSNSFNLYRQEKYSPNTLAKLASSSLRHHRTPLSLAKLAAQQAAGLLGKVPPDASAANYSAGGSGGASSSRTGAEQFKSASNSLASPSSFANVVATEAQSVSSQCVQITKQLMDASLPSPGPLLGKTRLVDHYNQPRTAMSKQKTIEFLVVPTEAAISLVDSNKTTPSKEPPITPINLDEAFTSRTQKMLQMCGGEITIVEKTEEKVPRFGSSGGSIVSISSSSPESLPENSPLSIRTGLLSGGSIIESPISAKRKPSSTTTSNVPASPANVTPILPMSRLSNSQNMIANYFQFPPPPINSITAYNPLTLPPKQPEFNSDIPAAIEATKIVHGGKIIPFVPGIPGPNSLSANAPMSPIISSIPHEKGSERIFSPNPAGLFAGNISLGTTPYRSINLSISSAVVSPSASAVHAAKLSKSPEPPPSKALSTIKSQSSSEINDSSSSSANHPHSLSAVQQQQQHHAWTSTTPSRDGNQMISEKPFNFMRIADNLSPPKIRIESSSKVAQGNLEVSATNLEKLKPRPKLLAQMADVSPLHINVESTPNDASPPNLRNVHETTPEKIKVPPTVVDSDKGNTLLTKHLTTKFLRPSSLPLKPGTFTPKKHHGITPTANTLPLISPETPRPSKHCVQLYLNGHAYTYLGLKCSTKPFYCTVNRPQPVYALFAGRPELSMYSNWQTCAENNPHPLGFSPKEMMSLYDSRQRSHTNYQGSKFTMSSKTTTTCAPSDKIHDPLKVFDTNDTIRQRTEDASSDLSDKTKVLNETLPKTSGVNLSTVPGGYKSNEDYTYVRGRGRGRYVCIECGMRCIKPCTLKKHIRTVHSDVRPYTCRHCMFSFKTKGNLTKHMESKAHYKKCLEKGINPQIPIDDDVNSEEDRPANASHGRNLSQTNDDCDTISDDYSDGDGDGDDLEIDMESSDNEDAKLPDHEAAHCLLSLSQRSPCEESNVSAKSLVPSQPTTYPYVQSDLITAPKINQSNKSEFTLSLHDGFSKTTDTVISKMSIHLSPEISATATAAAISSKILTETKSKRITTASSDAIDLSKPRNVPNASSSSSSSSESRDMETKSTMTQPSYVGAAELIKSLMTLSDKVPAIPSPSYDLNLTPASCNGQQPNLTNNMHLQTYLTESALQKSKMKLSQVHTLNAFDEKSSHTFFKESGPAFFSMLSKKLDHIEISPRPRSVITANLDRNDAKMTMTETKPTKNEQCLPENMSIDNQAVNDDAKMNISSEKGHIIENPDKDTVKVELHIAKPTDETLDLAKGINDQSGMETLAEIAANSVKLDASKAAETSVAIHDASSSAHKALSATQSDKTVRKESSAKNIASEYLKLANEQDNAIDDSSTSSDSDAMTDSGSKQVRRSSVMSLVPGQDALMSARTVVVGEDGFKSKSANASDLPRVALPRGTSTAAVSRTNVAFIQEDGGPSRCSLCPASFPKSHQLVLHMNIHYMNPERKFRCNSCGINFQTQGRLQKHMRSETHSSKVNIVETQGNSTSKNPRPFECSDCSRAFRIHGHLAKHLRSKTHVQRLENLQKLPFGTYQMIEEARINLTDIDTTDCDNSLASLKALAEKLKVESVSTEKRKASTESYESNSSMGGAKDHTQSTASDNTTDINTGSMIKKRKLNDSCKDTLTISDGDDN